MRVKFVELSGFRGFRTRVRFEFPPGFAVLSGRNGSGKSTVFDAIDFAMTGTISKFGVTEAKGGGLDEHIWWVGGGSGERPEVSVGFGDGDGNDFVVKRTPAGPNMGPDEIVSKLCAAGQAPPTAASMLQTALIRDELIAGLSMDLSERARFELVREAVGRAVAPDLSRRAKSVASAANEARKAQEDRVRELNQRLGALLSQHTEARSLAQRSAEVSEALRAAELETGAADAPIAERAAALRGAIVARRAALEEAERAIAEAERLSGELGYLRSPGHQAALAAASSAAEAAAREAAEAEGDLAAAAAAEEAEKAADEYAARLSALVESGSAIGLQDGCCPLCAASRTEEEFERALSSARAGLADRGRRLAGAASAVRDAQRRAAAAAQGAAEALARLRELAGRAAAAEQRRAQIAAAFARLGLRAAPEDPALAQEELLAAREGLVTLQRALFALESSSAVERVKSLESQIAALREQIERESLSLVAAQRAADAAHRIENATQSVVNDILGEQFDTVLPLLKELYRRLRPHAEWGEISSSFGGRVRGSLNFVVGEKYNPQFLFSSGQRRAAGLAFLLAVHLSRPWCKWRSLLLDDPVQHIDDYRALNLAEVLAAIGRSGRQVIIAVEDPALADLLCRKLGGAAPRAGRIFELAPTDDGSAGILKERDIYPLPSRALRRA